MSNGHSGTIVSSGVGCVTAKALSRALRRGNVDCLPSSMPIITNLQNVISTIRDAVDFLKSVRNPIRGLAETAIAASVEPDLGIRALLAEDFEDHVDQLDRSLQAPPSALLKPGASAQRVTLPSTGEYIVAPANIALDPKGLPVTSPRGAFATSREISDTLTMLDQTLMRLDSLIQGYERDEAFLARRVKALKSTM